MSQDAILRQKTWTAAALSAAGFRQYTPIKQLIMARALQRTKTFQTENETLTGSSGDIICYLPGTTRQPNLDAYDHWPVRRDIFVASYSPWDAPDWTPNAAEAHLLQLGCSPYYKSSPVWARILTHPQQVESLESAAPVTIPAGYWLIIGPAGEPYSMPDEAFHKRYSMPDTPASA